MVTLPGRTGIHHETGQPVRYPFIVFEDREKHSQLMKEIREQGRAFIEKKLADKDNPLTLPGKKQPTAKAIKKPIDHKSLAVTARLGQGKKTAAGGK